jgi:hypothetical protein
LHSITPPPPTVTLCVILQYPPPPPPHLNTYFLNDPLWVASLAVANIFALCIILVFAENKLNYKNNNKLFLFFLQQ